MFLYSATDSDSTDLFYNKEAVVSAWSLRKHVTSPIKLVTNAPEMKDFLAAKNWSPFDDVQLVDPGTHPKIAKVTAILEAGFDDLVFLDSDTLIYDDLSKVFEIGDFDVAAVPAHGRDRVVELDPEVERNRIWLLNTGVLFLRMGNTAELVAEWLDALKEQVHRFRKTPERIFDQKSFVEVVVKRKPDTLRLPNNFNWRCGVGGMMSGKCFVLHNHMMRKQLVGPVSEVLVPEKIEALLALGSRVNDSMISTVFPPIRTIDAPALSRTASMKLAD